MDAAVIRQRKRDVVEYGVDVEQRKQADQRRHQPPADQRGALRVARMNFERAARLPAEECQRNAQHKQYSRDGERPPGDIHPLRLFVHARNIRANRVCQLVQLGFRIHGFSAAVAVKNRAERGCRVVVPDRAFGDIRKRFAVFPDGAEVFEDFVALDVVAGDDGTIRGVPRAGLQRVSVARFHEQLLVFVLEHEV